MIKLKVNDKDIVVEDGLTVLQACEIAGAEIPRFCYHEKLSIAGNCRMCLVEMDKSSKPIASCAMPATEGMVIRTNTEKVEKARKGVMEFLLANHPLDCPVCDQGGECDLQDQSMFYGIDKSRFKENKRYVPEKYMGPLIKTQMTRCIHCTRCIRFATEVAGVPEIGAIGRGENMQITTYLEKAMESEMSANVIDLCPVGALTSKPYVFEARPWELKKTETIDVMDSIGSNIRVDTYGWEVKRVLPIINEDINEEWISDKTRYACDGLKYQRLDKPYFKNNGKFISISWNDAYNKIIEEFKKVNNDEIAAFTGDLSNMETMFSVKELFNKIISSENIEHRSEDYYYDDTQRNNYLFNSQINGIEESDFILLIGTNPRYEGTVLNSRIRKSYLKNKTKIYSFGDIGDQTYPYEILKDDAQEIKNFFNSKGEIFDIFKSSNSPMIIYGESFLNLKSAEYLFDFMKKLNKSNEFKFKEKWQILNFLPRDASSVGAKDLKIKNPKSSRNFVLNKLYLNEFRLLFLFGQDNLKLNKKNEFIVYIGSHGDRGAEIADIILPSPAYTEQDGYFTNLEGKTQKCFKASYPTGIAKEEWLIINELSEKISGKKLFDTKANLYDSMNNYLKSSKKKEIVNDVNLKFYEEKVKINDLDYYYSNVIARASKTMSECKNAKLNMKKTGTEG